MSSLPRLLRHFLPAAALALALVTCLAAEPLHWVGTWATAARTEDAAKEPAVVPGTTIRQIIRLSAGGRQVRLRLSNAFGTTPLAFHGAHLALAGPDGSIQPGSDHVLLFNGGATASIPPGASLVSDPLEFPASAFADVALSLHVAAVPAVLTMHHGSRTTSYLQAGDFLTAPVLPAPTKIVRWYFTSAIDVLAPAPVGAVALLGDSFTDGYGTTTDHHNRWTDALAQRLAGRVGVLNLGIGGNRLLRDGLGPNMLARLDRDVLVQTGVRWLVVQAGINDLGTANEARKKGEPFASAADVIAAYGQIIDRAHAQDLRVIGTTLPPCRGHTSYGSAEADADRQTVNAWIRTSGRFDAVVDFETALRDPADPSRLAPAFDSGDHLHPSLAGYVEMARVFNLTLLGLPADQR
jgi:lysophospholipase L1-like esterase